MAASKGAEVRRNPDNPSQVAIKTGPKVTVGQWFVFDVDNGGAYTDGEREGVADWTAL